MKAEIRYIANDGRAFETPEQARVHEFIEDVLMEIDNRWGGKGCSTSEFRHYVRVMLETPDMRSWLWKKLDELQLSS